MHYATVYYVHDLRARQPEGVWTMHHYPFAAEVESKRRQPGSNRGKTDPSALQFRGKTCHLCCDDEDGPSYDLWHVLFECPATSQSSDVVTVRQSCAEFLLWLCDAIENAVRWNSESMSDTRAAGVSHEQIFATVQRVRDAAPGYDWNCVPGHWLVYTLLLALPFPACVVRPDAQNPVWHCKQKRRVKGVQHERDLSGRPDLPLPELPDAQFSLPELVGQMFDSVILPGDAMRPVADGWCRFAEGQLFRLGRVVRPLRVAAETVRAAARAAAGAGADGWSTTSFVPTTDTDAGSGSTADSLTDSDSVSGANSATESAGGSHLEHLLDVQAGELGQQ